MCTQYCPAIQPSFPGMSAACVLSHHSWLFVTLWTIARQAPLSPGFSRQEHWSGLPNPPPKDLANPGIEGVSLSLQQWQVGSLPLGTPGKLPPRWLFHTFSSFLKLPHLLLPSHWWSCLTFYRGNQNNQPGISASSYFKKHRVPSASCLQGHGPRASTLMLGFFPILCTWPLFPTQSQSFPHPGSRAVALSPSQAFCPNCVPLSFVHQSRLQLALLPCLLACPLDTGYLSQGSTQSDPVPPLPESYHWLLSVWSS